MFRVKICGVTIPSDAAWAAEAGADAVGINFFPGSRRYVPPEAAAPIVDAARGRATPVGVFVDEDPEVIVAVCRRLRIEVVQLSGDESPDAAARLPFARIKAVRQGEGAAEAYRDYPCEAFLLDAAAPGEYGGTGRTIDWTAAAAVGPSLGKPWMLAGGLTPENVMGAIRRARPFGVDVASGVERLPGRKDPEKVALFVRNAKEGLGNEPVR